MTLVLSIIFVLLTRSLDGSLFDPDTSNYDAYGLKVAANDNLIVEALNDYQQFYIQFAPYSSNVVQSTNLFCAIDFNASSQYIYAVAIGKNQSSSQLYFFFVGELTNIEEDEYLNRTFVGMLSYTDNITLSNATVVDCDQFQYDVNYITSPHPHQEYLTLAVDPLGLAAYGFSNNFSFSYDVESQNLSWWPGSSFWPNSTFMPHAVDCREEYGVVAGFVDNGQNSRIKFSPFVYLFDMTVSTAPTVLSSWTYTVTGTWQAGQTNAGADQYAAKYDMSVAINTIGQVLVGIQSMNSVFLFSTNGTTMTLVTWRDNGRSLGFGKGVAWLGFTGTSIAILVNSYTFSYSWLSSNIYIYDNFTNASTPVSIFPNSQQALSINMDPSFLNIISTPTHLVFLDIYGNTFVILSSPAGFYSSTTGSETQSLPAFSDQAACIAGTYKDQASIRPCSLCPAGTKNSGNSSTSCVSCAVSTFCSLGAVSDVNSSGLSIITQAGAYPKSPENTVFDDILIQNMFGIGPTSHCISVSPIFWALMIGILAVLIMALMTLLKHCIKHPKGVETQKKLTYIFKRADLISEGEQWIGGLVSFSVVVLLIFAYVFSNGYYSQYPVETAGPSNFACDTTIRNAKFETTLQSLAVPLSTEEQKIFNLLNEQEFTLNVDFVNTIFSCNSLISAFLLLGSLWQTISITSCRYSGYILSVGVVLPYKGITIRFVLPDIQIIGGLRIGLSGTGEEEEDMILKDLEFYQPFNLSDNILAQNVEVTMQITKVVNETIALIGDESKLSGLWIPTFNINNYYAFVSESNYAYATSTETNLTIYISETPYYIKNEQAPIAKQAEVIFHNLLFTIVVLEIFGLIFLICKLMLIPLLSLIVKKCRPLSNRVEGEHPNNEKVQGSHSSIEMTGENGKDE